MARSVLGLDIGGANLKAAHSSGAARLHPFELWKSPALLPSALRELIGSMPAHDTLAITMTGELCDCFEDRCQGVNVILDAVAGVAGPTPIHAWQADERLVSPAEAKRAPLKTASANWLALATFAGRFAPRGPALLVDIGSTTTDIVALDCGRPHPIGRTDAERLRSGELVYTGVRRTPVCALLQQGVAAELFATTLDVYLLLGSLPEDPQEHGTADGRPATCSAAHVRLARMLGTDGGTCTAEQTLALAREAAREQLSRIRSAVEQVQGCLPAPPQTAILSGSGEFLARAVLEEHWNAPPTHVVSLAHELGPELSAASCAYAVARLALEQHPEFI